MIQEVSDSDLQVAAQPSPDKTCMSPPIQPFPSPVLGHSQEEED